MPMQILAWNNTFIKYVYIYFLNKHNQKGFNAKWFWFYYFRKVLEFVLADSILPALVSFVASCLTVTWCFFSSVSVSPIFWEID